MYKEDREESSDPLSAEALLAVRARRRLIEHELDERRFDLFQRKVLLAIMVAAFVLSAVAAM